MKSNNVCMRIAFREGMPIALCTPPGAQFLSQVLAFRFCQYPPIRKRLNTCQLDSIKAADICLEGSPFLSYCETCLRPSLKLFK